MAASESESETSFHTELSAGDAERRAYEPYRVAGAKPEVHAFRRWWLNNPINNLWTKKPNQWATFKKVQAGMPQEEAVKGGAHVMLEDVVQRGPTREELLADGGFELQDLPSDEAWFGTPDPAIYAQGTNNLNKQQLAEEVEKGNVVTLRQLKQHLATATPEQLKLWEQVLAMQRLKEQAFVELPGGEGRVSVWDLYNYVDNNPELQALVDKDPNSVLPKGGMTREERIKALAELAPWKLCGNERHMVLPPDISAKLGWGLLAGGSWYSRRPTRWLKGLDGVKDFDYGLYVHEEAAQQELGENWGGRGPNEVLSNKAFYKEAINRAPKMGMTLLAVASRPLPIDEVTQAWEQRLKQQIDKMEAASSSSADSSGKVLLSTAAASGSGSESGSYETTTASEEESSSGSSEQRVPVQQSRTVAAAPPKQQQQPAAKPPAQQPKPQAGQQQQQQQAAGRQQAAMTAVPAVVAQQQAAPAAHAAVSSSKAAPPVAADKAAIALPSSSSATAASAVVAAPAAEQQQQQLLVPSDEATEDIPGPDIAPRHLSLAMLCSLFDKDRLAAGTELMDLRGSKLREGSTIIFTAHPTGSLMVQAISPGLVKDQKSYVLGSVYDPKLTTALMSLFFDPDNTLDSEFTAAAGTTLLGVINGYRIDDGFRQSSIANAMLQAEDAYEASSSLFRRAKWQLPEVGKAPLQLPLVKNVRREVMYQKIEEAFESAVRAAAAIEVPADSDVNDVKVQRSIVYARRRAAEAELKQQLGALGLNVSGLTIPPADLPADLLSLARPLAEEAAAETLSAWR